MKYKIKSRDIDLYVVFQIQ